MTPGGWYGWLVVLNIMLNLVRVRGSEIYVRPTDLRRSKEYVVFYHTWVWGFLTGIQAEYVRSFRNKVLRFYPRGVSYIPEHQDISRYEENKILSE